MPWIHQKGATVYISKGVSNNFNWDMGIGLAFDPFDTEQKWNDRPTWQKAIFIIHLALVAAMFGFGIGLNDK